MSGRGVRSLTPDCESSLAPSCCRSFAVSSRLRRGRGLAPRCGRVCRWGSGVARGAAGHRGRYPFSFAVQLRGFAPAPGTVDSPTPLDVSVVPARKEYTATANLASQPLADGRGGAHHWRRRYVAVVLAVEHVEGATVATRWGLRLAERNASDCCGLCGPPGRSVFSVLFS